jgi:hypothetical protein
VEEGSAIFLNSINDIYLMKIRIKLVSWIQQSTFTDEKSFPTMIFPFIPLFSKHSPEVISYPFF